MKISSKGRYAVRVMADIASSNKQCVSLSEIAERQNISVKYLEKIFSILTKNKLLKSIMGSQGGYVLTKNAKDYTIAEILSATGDTPKLAPCLVSNCECPNKNQCFTISCWENLTKLIFDYLDKLTLEDIIHNKI